MSEDNTKENEKILPDLSQLSNLEFETAWSPVSNGYDKADRRGSDFKGAKFRDKPGDGRKFSDRRRDNSRREREDSNREHNRQDSRGRFRGDSDKFKGGKSAQPGKFQKASRRTEKRPSFSPSMEVLFYPDDAPFNKLIDAMKESKRTYQLFDIANLVLEKFDRCVILAKNLPDADGAVKPLFCAQPYNIPFDDEQQARRAAIEWRIESDFIPEETECEPPKGNFQVVNRCTITNELLGAPNWHRYGEFLREYHARKCPNVSFETFSASIESVRDPEQIAQWLEQMKKRTVYRLKEPAEGEQEVFDTLEAASNYVARKMAAELVKTYEQVRLKGANMERLARGRIRRNIEEERARQKKFPIVTANNLRGRLRRSGLTVYKRGSKGFAFVSAIKRKFLTEGETLSELPQKIFDFVLSNAGVTAGRLPYLIMGLPAPEGDMQKQPEAKEQLENAEAPKPTDETASQAAALTPEQTAQFNAILSELSWLISEGYVVEYANSSLQANPYMPKPKEKTEGKADSDGETAPEGDEPLESAPQKSASPERRQSDSAEEISEQISELSADANSAKANSEAGESAPEANAALQADADECKAAAESDESGQTGGDKDKSARGETATVAAPSDETPSENASAPEQATPKTEGENSDESR